MHATIAALIGASIAMSSSPTSAQSVRELRGPAGVLPLATEEPAPKLFVDPPVSDALARGLVVIQYRAENLRIVQVFGPNALDVTPRIGHIHVTVDDASWHWADGSGEPLIIQNLPPGPHKVLVELVNANHKPFDHAVVQFVIPPKAPPR